METWKNVLNYEDTYEVSDLGRVRRKSGYVNTGIKHSEKVFRKGRVLKQNQKRNGYLTVDLSKNNIVKTVSVHKLVATAFCPHPIGKDVVNHINAIKTDNRAENLEWVTDRENKDHALRNGLYESHRKKPIRCKQLNITFKSSYEAAEYINNKCFKNSKQVKGMASKIRSAALGYQKTAYGFTWEQC